MKFVFRALVIFFVQMTGRFCDAPWAGRRDAPSGFAGCAPCRLCRHGHPASIPPTFAPAALRASLAFRGSAPGPSPPRDAWRPCKRAEPACAGSAWPAPRGNGQGVAADTPWLAAAGCADACRPRLWRFSPVTSRRTVHAHNARPRDGTSMPRLKYCAAGCGGGVLACRWSVDLARVRERAGEAFMRGCRAGHNSFRSESAKGVLVSL